MKKPIRQVIYLQHRLFCFLALFLRTCHSLVRLCYPHALVTLCIWRSYILFHTAIPVVLYFISCISGYLQFANRTASTGRLYDAHRRMPCILYRDKESPNMHDVPSCFAYICTYYKEDAPAVSRAVSLTAYAQSPALPNHSVLFPTSIFNVIARLYLSFFHDTSASVRSPLAQAQGGQ